ncbi:MAG: hypothetical protein Fur0037_10800 [Planctomycetota bacterium]
MNFAHPWFLLASAGLVAIWVAAYRSKAPLRSGQRRVVTALQSASFLCAVLALAGPWTEGSSRAFRVFVGASRDARLEDMAAAFSGLGPRADSFLAIAAGADIAAGNPKSTDLVAPAGAPDLASALEAALSAIPAGASGEILLATDGRHDGRPLGGLAAPLTARGIPLHVRLLEPERPPLVLQRVGGPASVSPGEAFRLSMRILSRKAGTVPVEVFAGERSVATARIALRVGEHDYSIPVVLSDEGPSSLRVVVSSPGPRTEERTAVFVRGPMKILHWTGDASRREALSATLAPHGISAVDFDASVPIEQQLRACSCVFLDDMPADGWEREHQRAVRDAVLARGVGLLLSGTYENLGPGGYASSPLADILPVRMPQREERRDPSLALVLIIDTSGSMGGGRIELAKEVARLAISRLQPHDKVGIVEFYGNKRWAAPLQPATNAIEITRALNRLQAGGGTIIYGALEEAYYALLNARTRFQHVLVLTDGGVESGPFEALARRMAASGQTLSSVLIGPQANSPFLLNLAQWGRGRFYACPDRFQLPDLQFREPQSSLLPAVQERRLRIHRAEEAEAVAAFSSDQLPPTGGIVEARPRPGAEVLLRGEGGEPYLVAWDRGAGRVLVLAGQALGPLSGDLQSDPAYGAFLADALRSAASGANSWSPEIRCSTTERGVRVLLELPAGSSLPAAPTARFAGAGPPARAALVPSGASSFEGFLPFEDERPREILVESAGLVLGRAAAVRPLDRSPRAPLVTEDLRLLARLSGGSFEDASVPVHSLSRPARTPQVARLERPLLLAALLIFLFSVLLRRVPLDSLGSRGAGLAALAVCLAASAPARAQGKIEGEAEIRARIEETLRESGSLDGLRAEWKDPTPLQRLCLALAEGDLDGAAALAEDPALSASKIGLRVDLLDVLGRPEEALSALRAMWSAGEAEMPTVESRLREALLLHDVGQKDEAGKVLERLVAERPECTDRAGLVAGMLGFHDLALAWHRPESHSGKLAFEARLRRGFWQLRRSDARGAVAEFQGAFRAATMRRDRLYALSQVVEAARSGGILGEVVDGWVRRARGEGEPLEISEFLVMLEALRGLGRADEGLRLLGRLDAGTRHELEDVALDLALAASDPEAAIGQLEKRLAEDPHDAESRSALAVLLSDLRREKDAALVIERGIPSAKPAELRLLAKTSSDLGLRQSLELVAAAIAGLGKDGSAVEAALVLAAHERSSGRDAEAAKRLLDARSAARRPADRMRLAEELESIGRRADAVALYRQLYEETRAEDLGLRLAWLLGESKDEAERKEAQDLFRRIWTTASSEARRVQAEEQVLDLAAREGNLADLAIELEEELEAPGDDDRTALRDALVKIYSRARDTIGAVQVLRKWAGRHPDREIDALGREARVYLSAEEYRNHEQTLEALLRKDPAHEKDYRQQLAMSALERGRPADARRYLKGLLDRPGEPDQVAIEFAAGVHELAGLHEDAVKLYRRAIATHPERVETFLLLGNALRSAGRREQAIGIFQELLPHPLPDDLFVVAVDGLLNMEAPASILAAAARIVRLWISKRPDQVFLHRLLQDLLEAEGDEEGRLLDLEDTLVVAGEQRASFVRELMQEAEARRDWKTYVRHGRALLVLGDEVPPSVFLSIGEALLKSEDIDGAARAFARARLTTDFTSVEQRMAEAYEGAGRLADAERIRAHVLRRMPDDPKAHLEVARLAELQGARERALPGFLKVALALLPAELERRAARLSPSPKESAAAARTFSRNRNVDREPVDFAVPFQGALRCAGDRASIEPLCSALWKEASADGAGPARRFAAMSLLGDLATSFEDETLASRVRDASALLLAEGNDAKLRLAALTRLVDEGYLDEAREASRTLPDDAASSWQKFRIAFLSGDDRSLVAACEKAPAALLPDAIRCLLLSGRSEPARALLALLDRRKEGEFEETEAARIEAHRLFGEVIDDTPLRAHRLQVALQKQGDLRSRGNAILSALRGYPALDAGVRASHLAAIAAEALAAKDIPLGERILREWASALDPETAGKLAELLFSKIDQVYAIGSRARYLSALPVARGLEILKRALSRFPAEEQRQQCWSILRNPEGLSGEFLTGMLEGLKLDRLTPSDRAMISSLARQSARDAAAQKALAELLARQLPDDPCTGLLIARSSPPERRREIALSALRKLLEASSLQSRDMTAAESLLRMVTPADARAMLAGATTDVPPLFRVALLRRVNDKQAAADCLIEAFRAKPGDVSLLYTAAQYLEGEGMLEQAAEIYSLARDRSPAFYPYQAQQLASIQLRLGRDEDALETLKAAKDTMASNFRVHIAVLAGIRDAGWRASELRRVVQQRSASKRSSILYYRPSLAAGGKLDRLSAALARPEFPPLLPESRLDYGDARSDFDLLGWLPEGEACARDLLRTMPAEERDGDLGIYRGLLASARRNGNAGRLLDEALARLERSPFAAEPSRLVLAAAQIGMKVPAQAFRRAVARRIDRRRIDGQALVEVLTAALATGDERTAAGILSAILASRESAASSGLGANLAGVVEMVARSDPDRLLALAPAGEDELIFDVDPEVLAALVRANLDARTVVERWEGAVTGWLDDSQSGGRYALLQLPWSGLMLEAEGTDAAERVLRLLPEYAMPSSGMHLLGAAIPPLERWASAGEAPRFAEFLIEGARAGDESRRGLFVRLCAVLAFRLREAGRVEEARALATRARDAASDLPLRWRDWFLD